MLPLSRKWLGKVFRRLHSYKSAKEMFNQDTFEITLPKSLNVGSRSILGFMLRTHNVDPVTIDFRLNGKKVWNWKYSPGKRVRHFQEVVGGNTLQVGKNVLSMHGSSDAGFAVAVSDMVLWWQANI